MFARYFVELPLPAEDVRRALLADPQTWLPGLATEANRRGEHLLAAVGFGNTVRVATQVEIELGRPIRIQTKTILPIRWRATGHEGLLPALDADIEVAPLTPTATQLSMSARYVPPFGTLGRAVDRALLHRVAEATLKEFLDRVGAAVLVEAAPAAER